MLHRRTYDTLSDTGTVLLWKVTIAGGLIVVQDSPSAITLWQETWDQALVEIATYDLKRNDESHTIESFQQAQDIARNLLASVEVVV